MIYVGKASSLRQRLSNYFQDPRNLHPRTAQMVATAETVEWIEVRNEVEALMLEYSLIKQHRPRFNIRLRDDKSYPFLAVTLDEEWPRAMVMRGRKRKGVRYFGPVRPRLRHPRDARPAAAHASRSARAPTTSSTSTSGSAGRACCSTSRSAAGPCVGEIDDEPTTTQLVDELLDFLDGDTDDDRQAARAPRCARRPTSSSSSGRPGCATGSPAVRKAIEKQQMVAERSEDLDVIGIADDELEAAVQVFYVRKGRVVGRKGFVVDKVEDLTPGELVDRILEELYGDEPPLGVPEAGARARSSPTTSTTYEEWLTHAARVAGADPRAAARRQARAARDGHAQRQGGVRPPPPAPRRRPQQPGRALNELQDCLGLPEAPLRIECYDMATSRARDYVGSMVVLEDGLPNKREYRRFKIKDVPGNDDFAAMEEVLTRRLTAYLAERDRPLDRAGSGRASSPTRRSCCSSTAARASSAWPSGCVDELGLDDEIPVASLAKRFEEVYVPGQSRARSTCPRQ